MLTKEVINSISLHLLVYSKWLLSYVQYVSCSWEQAVNCVYSSSSSAIVFCLCAWRQHRHRHYYHSHNSTIAKYSILNHFYYRFHCSPTHSLFHVPSSFISGMAQIASLKLHRLKNVYINRLPRDFRIRMHKHTHTHKRYAIAKYDADIVSKTQHTLFACHYSIIT